MPVEKVPTSILYEFKDEIRELYDRGYTQNQILQYLDEMHDVQTTQQNLSLFINRHIANESNTKEVRTSDDEIKKENKFDELDKKFSHLL